MRIYKLAHSFIIAMALTVIAMPIHAEQAPVYDADNLPPSFAGEADSGRMPQVSENSSAQSFAYAPSNPPPPAPAPSLSNDQRLTRMEQQITNMQNSDGSAQLDALRKEVQGLRNQVDELTHKLQQAENQQRSMYTDFEKRLAQAPAAPTAVSAPPVRETPKAVARSEAPPAAVQQDEVLASSKAATARMAALKAAAKPQSSQPNVAEEQEIYQTAYNHIRAKKYNEAVKALQGMLEKYPSGQFAANAHYWLGELYGLMGKNDQAMKEFETVVKSYPDNPRVSDAQLKLGLIYAAQSKWVDAKSAFKKVINRYPGSASARLASDQLKQIKLAGH